jgi:Gpi18-like mannosyltransferase
MYMPPDSRVRRTIDGIRARALPALPDFVIALVGIGLALALRLSLLEFKSIDYFNYTKVWYNTLKTGGFYAFGQSFSNYNLPYLYLLYLVARFLPGVPALIATKLPSLIADFVCAWIAYRLVRLKYENSPMPWFAALAVLFAPTIVLNSAFWGQADAIYACAALACIYCLLRRQAMAAMLFFGLAFALKAQAMFLFPLLLGLVLRREIAWRHLLLVPAVMLLVLVPALVAGRPLLDLLLIYPSQAGQYEQLSMHAPSALSWIPDTGRFYPYFYPAGLVLAAAVGLAYSFAIYKGPAKMTPTVLLQLAMISVLLMPFVLPKMHERYFFLADVLSIIIAFYLPRYFFVPVLMTTISFFAYQPTLFGEEPVPIGMLALGVLALLIVLCRRALLDLFARSPEN